MGFEPCAHPAPRHCANDMVATEFRAGLPARPIGVCFSAMDHNVTALERAFQLAKSGNCASVPDLRQRLKQEGYALQTIVGRTLTRAAGGAHEGGGHKERCLGDPKAGSVPPTRSATPPRSCASPRAGSRRTFPADDGKDKAAQSPAGGGAARREPQRSAPGGASRSPGRPRPSAGAAELRQACLDRHPTDLGSACRLAGMPGFGR